MGFYGVLELSGVTLHGLPVVPGACEMVLDAHHPALDLAGDAGPWLLDAGDPVPLPIASPALDLSAADEDLILICPY